MVFLDSSPDVLNSHVRLKSATTDSVWYCALSVLTKSRDNEPAMFPFRDAVIKELKERFSVRASAQCGPDPGAFRGATDHGLMLHMVQKHGETTARELHDLPFW